MINGNIDDGRAQDVEPIFFEDKQIKKWKSDNIIQFDCGLFTAIELGTWDPIVIYSQEANCPIHKLEHFISVETIDYIDGCSQIEHDFKLLNKIYKYQLEQYILIKKILDENKIKNSGEIIDKLKGLRIKTDLISNELLHILQNISDVK